MGSFSDYVLIYIEESQEIQILEAIEKIIFTVLNQNRFKVIGISKFKEIDNYKDKFLIDYIYVQKSGNKDHWVSNEIKTIVHGVYPQKISQVHGYRFAYISEWLSKNFSNNKIPFVPLITEVSKTKENLKKNPPNFKNKEELKKWLIDFHNDVNKMLKKPIYTPQTTNIAKK